MTVTNITNNTPTFKDVLELEAQSKALMRQGKTTQAAWAQRDANLMRQTIQARAEQAHNLLFA